jgi:predicted AAA+ superfamily ATPase
MSGELYRRNAAPDLHAAMADTPVVAIVGPRQCGKSTLAQQYMEERGGTYVSLDDAGRRAAANEDPTGFVEDADLPFAIDEFQKAPALLDAIKHRVDRARRGGARPAGMFLLTGSANVWATLRISESMAGRAERIQLWPLSQGEIEGRRERFVDRLLEGQVSRLADCQTGRTAVSARLLAGGYPEMLARTDPRRRARWASNYVEMVVERDAHDLTERGQYLDELPRLLDLAAARVSGLLETTAMGNAIGMKKDTVRRYLALLEQLYLIRRTPAWSRNLGQRLVKSPKLWMPDTGLACELLGYSQQRFETDETATAGALFENFVAGEIAKQATWSETPMRLHHFRTAGGREVDVLVEAADGRVAGIEVKLGSTPSRGDFRSLAYLRDKVGDRFAGGVVVGTGAETLPFGDRLWSVPAAGLWE